MEQSENSELDKDSRLDEMLSNLLNLPNAEWCQCCVRICNKSEIRLCFFCDQEVCYQCLLKFGFCKHCAQKIKKLINN